MITKTTKTELKLKKIYFNDNILIDENGEVINIIDDLKAVFGDNQFDLTCVLTEKSDYDIQAFKDADSK